MPDKKLTFGFDEVIRGLKAGKTYGRQSWSTGETIQMIVPRQIYSVPCLFRHIEYTSSFGARLTGWVPSQWEMFAEDWQEA